MALINSLEDHRGIWQSTCFRKFALFLIDTSLGLISLLLTILMLTSLGAPFTAFELLATLAPIMILCRSASSLYFNFYSNLWKYASGEDFIKIAKAVFSGSVLMFVSVLSSGFAIGELTVLFWVDCMCMTLFLGSSRLGWILFRERKKREEIFDRYDRKLKKVLIFGAGDAGATLYDRIRREGSPYTLSGFIDDDLGKLDQIIGLSKVLGDRSAIPRLVATLGIEEIFIACNKIDKDGLNELVAICKDCDLKYKIAGSVMDLSTEKVHVSSLKKIDIEELLGREPVSLDLKGIENMVRGKKVLVTGAGGSIGSELCRQIVQFEPSDLVMVDNGENYLFNLSMSLKPRTATNAVFKFCSVTNRSKLEGVFKQYGPDLVFHAAAYKHVPMMESNVDEAVKNNVYGTKITADMAHKYGADRFVLVSTDKVVQPKSIMGMTKKVAEMYIQYINQKSNTRYMIVRFGNVLGSMGSIVPIFQKQIEEGGPVTVTHPGMSRYFMLIPEAAQLILQSAALGERGGVFLLEMGEPVKIMDMACKMIRLHGLVPGKDMQIKIVGMRPGEKLTEELKMKSERILDTLHKKVKVLMTDEPVLEDLPLRLEILFKLSEKGDASGLRNLVNGENQSLPHQDASIIQNPLPALTAASQLKNGRGTDRILTRI